MVLKCVIGGFSSPVCYPQRRSTLICLSNALPKKRTQARAGSILGCSSSIGRDRTDSDRVACMTETIIEIKDGRISNLVAILFLWGLAGGSFWAAHLWNFWLLPIFVVSIIWILFSLPFVCSLFQPKCRWLAFDADTVIWRAWHGSKTATEYRLPLNSIYALKFLLSLPGNDSNFPGGDLVFVLHDGSERKLPSNLFPIVYRKRIEAAFRHWAPNVLIQEVYTGPSR